MPKAVFVGVYLQRDFIESDGALPVPGADGVVQAAVRLVTHARQHQIPVVFVQDLHAEDDPSFEAFPPHCVEGTEGAALHPALEADDAPVVPEHYVPDQSPDGIHVVPSRIHRTVLFDNLNADRLLGTAGLERDDSREYVVFGLPIDVGLRGVVQQLLARGCTTIVVSDGVAALDPSRASSHLAAMAGAGAHFLTVEGVTRRYP